MNHELLREGTGRDGWIDISNDLAEECARLGPQQVMLAQHRTLLDTVPAIEIGDPKMDSGRALLLLDAEAPLKRPPGGVEALLDSWAASTLAWAEGAQSLVQSVFSNDVLRHCGAASTQLPALERDAALAQLRLVSTLRQLILRAECFQLEEFSHNLGGFALLDRGASTAALVRSLEAHGAALAASGASRRLAAHVAALAAALNAVAQSSRVLLAPAGPRTPEGFSNVQSAALAAARAIAAVGPPVRIEAVEESQWVALLAQPTQPPRPLRLLSPSDSLLKWARVFEQLAMVAAVSKEALSNNGAAQAHAQLWDLFPVDGAVPELGLIARSVLHLCMFPVQRNVHWPAVLGPIPHPAEPTVYVVPAKPLWGLYAASDVFAANPLWGHSAPSESTETPQEQRAALVQMAAFCWNPPRHQRLLKALARFWAARAAAAESQGASEHALALQRRATAAAAHSVSLLARIGALRDGERAWVARLVDWLWRRYFGSLASSSDALARHVASSATWTPLDRAYTRQWAAAALQAALLPTPSAPYITGATPAGVRGFSERFRVVAAAGENLEAVFAALQTQGEYVPVDESSAHAALHLCSLPRT